MPSYGSGRDVGYGGSGVGQVRDTYGRFAGATGVEIAGFDAMGAEIAAYEEAVRQRVFANARALADEIEQYMKDNASWEDRTGDARESLFAEAISDDRSVTIVLGYGPDIFYAYFLEHYTYSGESYAIVGPTVERYGPIAMSRVAS